MIKAKSWFPALLAIVAASCALNPKAPVALVGARSDLSALTGQWVGDFSSAATGREGTIVFNLLAETDTARGEVWMIGRPTYANGNRMGPPPGPEISRPAQVLTIQLVMVEGDLLSGVLDPYLDPETGVELVTVFRGRLEGDRITGTFASTNEATGDLSTGRWAVQRKSGPAPR